VSVTEAPAADVRGSAAGRGDAALVASVAELVALEACEAGVLAGAWLSEHAETTSATAGPRIAKPLLRRMRPNVARTVPAHGEVEPYGVRPMPCQDGTIW
jgi:hypothetical protein